MVNLSPPMHEPFAIALYLAMCNVIEVLLAAYLLHGRIAARTGFSRPRQRVDLPVCLRGDCGSGGCFSFCLAESYGVVRMVDVSLFSELVHRRCIGYRHHDTAVSLVSEAVQDLQNVRSRPVNLIALLCCLSLVVFWQTSLPLLFVILLCLLLLEVRLESGRLRGGASRGLRYWRVLHCPRPWTDSR